MDTKKILEFRAHYEYMPEEEIALLHANPHLSEEAKVALNEVIHARKIDLAKIRQEEAEEEFQIDENRKLIAEKKEKQNAKLFKWTLIIGLPLIVLGALVRPEKTIETLISTVIQGIVLAVVAWMISSLKKRK